MQLHNYFKEAKKLITNQKFTQLKTLELQKTEYFNWVEEIFYGINVKEFGEDKALIWRYNDQVKTYSYKEMYEVSNQFLNLLQQHGAHKGDRIYSLLPLIPANWISFIATIKGGFIMMPTATNQRLKDR